jgi:hypothetical protein
MKNTTLALLFTFFAAAATAQDSYVALEQFKTTQFMREFLDLREAAENSVRDFKRKQAKYSDEEVQKVIDAYNSSAEYFNQALYNIKGDLLDKQKRKFIVLFPDDYSKQVECDLRRAEDFYKTTFQKEVQELTAADGGTGNFLALVPTLFQYAQSAFDIFKKIQDELKKLNEAVLDKYLINEYKFKNWDEIAQ